MRLRLFPPGPPIRSPIRGSPDPSLAERLGFQLRHRYRQAPERRMCDVTIVVPFWPLCLAAAVLPTL